MRNLKLPLTELLKHGQGKMEKPIISVGGTGTRTFLWVGDSKSGCYSFTRDRAGTLKRFAQSILNRLSKP